MRLLFVKEALAWPRSSGHDVHCFHMMRALGALGHEVSLATVKPIPEQAIAGLPLQDCHCIGEATDDADVPPLPLSRLQERFRSYWGIDPARIRAVASAARAGEADAVVVVGLNVLPYLGAVSGALRVWYAADEWAWHHLSQVRVLRPSTWGNIKEAAVKGLYERAYASMLDRVWVVTDEDGRAMRRVAGVGGVDVLPNGVDTDHFAPRSCSQTPNSCVFWGRLDFGPNLQGLEWFCRRVWPRVRRAFPGARFTIYGFQPTPEAQNLGNLDGVKVVPNLPDLRDEIATHQVVVLPFVSGGGIKNKLLEAAAMGKAVVCTGRAYGGLRGQAEAPFRRAERLSQWVRELTSLWADADQRGRLGDAARLWVTERHTWDAAARTAAAGLEAMLGARQPA
ncbi:MAG TPA: glycosyltransferase family 4 protein [Gemmataceae bacterium]|nr:glycosyltransferase family 4 protein [Gemmataceae bacterium]